MGYALGFRDPEVVGDLVLPHVNEAVGLGPRGTVLPAALWGMAMYDLSRFAEPSMDPPHPSPPPLLGSIGSTLVEDVREEHAMHSVGAAAVDGPRPCSSPTVPGPPSEPRPTSPSPVCAQSASPGLPPEVIVLSDSDSDADIGDGSGVRRAKECVPNMGSVTAPADAFRVGAPGAGGMGSRKRPRGPGSRRQQYAAPPPPVRQYRVPSPSRVGGSDAVAPTVRPQRLVPRRRGREVTECPPRKRPAVGQGLAPSRGISATCGGGGGGGGALAPGLHDMLVPPAGSVERVGSSARGRLGAVAVGCGAPNAAPSAPARAAADGRARLWAVRKLVEGGGRWSWRWRLAVAGGQPSEQAVDVGHPPRGLGNSYAWRPPGETSATVEELRTRGTVVLAGIEGLGVGGGGMGRWATPPPPGLPGPEFLRDGDDPPVVPQFLMALPLYARVLALLSGSACWLQRKLSAPGPLLLQRIELFVDRVFWVAEDFALGSALDVIFLALCEFAEPAWEALLHLNTSPKPSLAAVVPEVVQRGPGAVGSYRIPDSLWREVVPADFLESAAGNDVERDPQGGAGRVSGLVGRFFAAVERLGIFRELRDGTTPSVFPFIIPMSSRKVSLILSCVGLNEESPDPPHFALPSWEGICRLLNQTPPGQRLYATHIDLTNAFWSFVVPEGVDTAFRARMRPGGPVVGATRLSFGWKFSPYLCQRILGTCYDRTSRGMWSYCITWTTLS